MPAERRIASNCIVLKLLPSGERFTLVYLLSSDCGLLQLLKRNLAKSNSFPIDLFDQGEAHFDHKSAESSNNGFLTDFVVTRKRSGLGKSYRTLQAASWLSGFLLANPLHDESEDDLFSLAQRALDALNDGHPAPAILLKTLYVFARDEGYPVLEDWAKTLPAQLSSNVANLLNTPLAEIDLEKELQQNAFNSLSRYIEQNTQIHLPQV